MFTDHEILDARNRTSAVLADPALKAMREDVQYTYGFMCMEQRNAARQLRFHGAVTMPLHRTEDYQQSISAYEAARAHAIEAAGIQSDAALQMTTAERRAQLARVLFPPENWGRTKYANEETRIAAFRAVDLQGRPWPAEVIARRMAEWEALNA